MYHIWNYETLTYVQYDLPIFVYLFHFRLSSLTLRQTSQPEGEHVRMLFHIEQTCVYQRRNGKRTTYCNIYILVKPQVNASDWHLEYPVGKFRWKSSWKNQLKFSQNYPNSSLKSSWVACSTGFQAELVLGLRHQFPSTWSQIRQHNWKQILVCQNWLIPQWHFSTPPLHGFMLLLYSIQEQFTLPNSYDLQSTELHVVLCCTDVTFATK